MPGANGSSPVTHRVAHTKMARVNPAALFKEIFQSLRPSIFNECLRNIAQPVTLAENQRLHGSVIHRRHERYALENTPESK